MRICLTGANGLLGQALCRRLSEREDFTVLATSRQDAARTPSVHRHRTLDVTDPEAVRSVFEASAPEVVVHCAALTRVDECEERPEACRTVNVDGLRYVAEATAALGARLVHLSTDFVFDGEGGPYAEDDPTGPVNVYGRSKLESERLLAEGPLEDWVIARTVLLFGTGRELGRSNLVLWLVDELAAGRSVRIVTDQYRTPTYVEDLAAGIERLTTSDTRGRYHLAGPDLVSVFELARRVAKVFDLDTTLLEPTTSAELGQRARRPPRTGLHIEKARRDLGFQPRSIEAALHDLRAVVDWPGRNR